MTTDNSEAIESSEARVMELENMRDFHTNNGEMEQAASYEDQIESVLDNIEDLEDEDEEEEEEAEEDAAATYFAIASVEEGGGGGEEGGGEEEEKEDDEETEMIMAQQEEEVVMEEEEEEEVAAEEEEEEEEEEAAAAEEEEAAAAEAEEEGGEEQAEKDPMDPSQYDQDKLVQTAWEKIQKLYPSQEESFADAEKKLEAHFKKMNQDLRKGL